MSVFATAPEARNAAADSSRFSTKEDLTAIAGNWPSSRVVDIWNGIPGVPRVKKFMDRKTGIHRVWCAIQQLEPAPAPEEDDVPATTSNNPAVLDCKGEARTTSSWAC